MIIDVNSPLQGESINRAEPWTSYNSQYLTRVFGVVENFKNFPNTLGFFSANEVMNDLSTAQYNPMYIRVRRPPVSIASSCGNPDPEANHPPGCPARSQELHRKARVPQDSCRILGR
jgi:hypothetical protein